MLTIRIAADCVQEDSGNEWLILLRPSKFQNNKAGTQDLTPEAPGQQETPRLSLGDRIKAPYPSFFADPVGQGTQQKQEDQVKT